MSLGSTRNLVSYLLASSPLLSLSPMNQTGLVPDSTPKIALNVLIVGCGIGGLSAAYCLGRVGHKITVIESASSIGEVGDWDPGFEPLAYSAGEGLRGKLEEMGVMPRELSPFYDASIIHCGIIMDKESDGRNEAKAWNETTEHPTITFT
ncbi:hypothetical protein DFH09DRAFT_1269378 [Mycena vulgaris]|nr:hypothetical protein DFH09DRAFT_1269378 [Mycena vulgaris]